jgi:hypothetical protein
LSINLGDPATLTIVNIAITILSWVIAWVGLLSGLKVKIDSIWKVFEAAALKGLMGSSYQLKKEDEDAIPENLKDELKRLAKRYKKHNGDPKKLLLELTRHHIDLIVNASEESNQTFNKMMGLAVVYMSKL